MPNKWRIIDLSQFEGRISAERGALRVSPIDREEVSVPISDVAVVLVGVKVSLSTGAIHRMTAADVAVLFCDWRGIPESAAYSWSSHTRIGARRMAQVTVSEPRRKSAWAQVIRAKVRGQACVLRAHGRPDASELMGLAKRIRSGDPQNVEAQAARIYWARLFEMSLVRNPGSGALEGPNSCLDYGYSVLRGHGIRAVLAAGLDPAIGLFHRGRSNAFNLVDDLIEPFRPCIDSIVADLPSGSSPADSDIKKRLVASANQRFLNDGTTIPAALTGLAQRLGGYFEGDSQRLLVSEWIGPDLSPAELAGG